MHSRLCPVTILMFVLGGFFAEAQHPWQRPMVRDRAEVERIMGEAKQKEPSRELRIVWVWDFDKNHAPGFHEYDKARDLFSGLFKRVPKVSVEAAHQFPSKQQWAKADLVVFYLQMQPMTSAQFAMMDAYLKRGGGMVAIHGAFIQGPLGGEVAKRFGLAWAGGKTQWGVLPIPSTVTAKRAHGIFDGFPEKLTLVDEHYWGLGGKVDQLTVLATAPAGPVRASKGPPKPGQLDGKKWPLFWTKEVGKGRVFGSIPGHNLFTFNDPYYRIILLRAMAWAMNVSFDPFKPLVTHNALIKTAEGKSGNEGVDKKFPALGDAHHTDKSYTLVWQDEFTGTKLDRKKWVAVDDAKIGQYGHGNGESQAYLDAEGDTFFVRDGRLTLVAHHAPDTKYPLRDKPYGEFKHIIDHQDFKSAKLTTEKLCSFTYGIFEARIKNPTDARGQHTAIPVWPAFWLLPEAKSAPFSGYWDKAAADAKRERAHSTWPYSGEIDIMEMSGRATRLYHAGAVYHNSPRNWTVGHIGWYSHYRRYDGAINPKQWIADQKLDSSLQPAPGQKSYVSGYHVYGCKWTKDRIAFMLDGKEWGPGLDLTKPTKFGGKKMYREYPFYLILNLAIGGNYFGVWGPNAPGPDKKGKNELYDFARFPQHMHIDWVRVYQRK